MHRGWGLLGSFTLGAAAMYLLDPQRGRRRQAQLGERMTRLGDHAREALDAASRDLANRTRGASAEVVSLFSGKPVTDQVLAARALANRPLRQLLGGRGRRGICLRNSITIHAPVDRVFAFWRHPENFPSFMRNVREVRPIGGGRYHWTVAGPAGTTMEWDAVTTRCVPNRVISWAALPRAAVEQSGSVYFEPAGDGTRLHITMRYNPPAGALGEAAAALFNADVRSEMDEDLLRMKSFLETGRPSHDAARATAGQGKQAAFAGQTIGQEMATGAGALPITGTGTQAGDLPGRGDSGSGAIDQAEQRATMAEDQDLAHALAAGRQAVNEASAFQGYALLPEQRIRIAKDAIDLLDAYRGRDEEVEGLITVLEGTIEGNQQLLDDARRPGV